MTAPRQPRDVGNGLICASFGAGGEWLSLATVDPELGFVELTGLPPFDEAERGDPAAVRRYRSWMREDERAFLSVQAGRATVTARQHAPQGSRRLVQQLSIRALPADRPADIMIRFRGRLARPAYAEITEVNPPRWQTSPTRLAVGDGVLSVLGEGPPLSVRARLRGLGDTPTAVPVGEDISWYLLGGSPRSAEARFAWPVGADELRIDIEAEFDLGVMPRPAWLGVDDAQPSSPAYPGIGADRSLVIPARLWEPARRISQRATDYVRECCALVVNGSERCILTDHRILPLSWTRDAFWQARLLLATWSIGVDPDDVRIVADHLRWLFVRCQRPDGRWVRSHYVDGARKDLPFQADQQIYPILELTDYVDAIGSYPQLPPGYHWAELLVAAWAAVKAAIDEETGLIAADENPADDVPAHPFLLSNQVLLWRASWRLASASARLGLPAGPFAEVAERTRAAVDELFVVDGPLGRQWAYAVDARGGSELYHDANDLPVAVAPLWGFCEADDPLWRTTMRFAVDPANPGFESGSRGGLGSRHTPGTWTLGDIQDWVAAGLRGDQVASEAALARLVELADLYDDMLPEAYDPEGSGSAVRHWFAWPGAAFAVLFHEQGRPPT